MEIHKHLLRKFQVPIIHSKTENATTSVNKSIPNLKNPFIIPGLKNVKVESQLNPNYAFDNF